MNLQRIKQSQIQVVEFYSQALMDRESKPSESVLRGASSPSAFFRSPIVTATAKIKKPSIGGIGRFFVYQKLKEDWVSDHYLMSLMPLFCKLWWNLRRKPSMWGSFMVNKYCKKLHPVIAKGKGASSGRK
ncbi:hypothetical protein H5410_054981 [Solanum commersonii]|uniref:Uncharacterized protein n=1 Tax=Solanum commersonii TaxID=4109 RepID=A0A9J5WHN7_SOLCO|nr:hypothetical protein H5410_054981 [Solanum commersonii]